MSFADEFARHFDATIYSYGQLAEISGVPKKTLTNWYKGVVRRPRLWQSVVQVAAAFQLDAADTNALLVAGDKPSLRELASEDLAPDDRDLLAPWLDAIVLLPPGAGELLWRYTARLASELSRLPAYFPHHVNVTFDLVYQDLYLAPLHKQTPASPTPPPDRDLVPWSVCRTRTPRAVILGQPGIGKTWMLKAEAVQQIKEATAAGGSFPNRLPLFVALSDLANALPDRSGLDGTLRVVATLAARSTPDLPEAPLVEAILAYMQAHPQQTTLLLDALDEVPARNGLRGIARYAVAQIGKGVGVRMWITTRLLGYLAAPLASELGADTVELEVQPLTETEIGRVVRAWYHGRTDRFIHLQHAMRRTPALIRQAATPLLLSLICMLSDVQPEALMDSRSRLLERIMRLLLEGNWRAFELRVPESRVRRKVRLLEVLAWRFATHEGRWNDSLSGDDLEDFIADLPVTRLLTHTWRQEWDAVYEGPLWELSERDGILIKGYFPADGAGSPVPFRFLHRIFHEVLVARYLIRRFDEVGFNAPEVHELFSRWMHDREWYRVLLLLNERLLTEPSTSTAPLVVHLRATLLQDGPDPSGQVAVAAGEMVETAGVDAFDPAVVKQLRGRLVRAMRNPDVGTLTRVHAGRMLSALGDPRPEITDVDAMPFVDVPAGSFWMGSDPTRDPDAAADEFPRHKIHLPGFRIGRYPVSNGQYAVFLAAPDGYVNPANWPEAIAVGRWRHGLVHRQIRVPLPDGRWRFDCQWLRMPTQSGWPATTPNHPMTGINWYEARAFVRWLDARYRRLGRLGPDEWLDLPSEAEWEKTARGDDGRTYTWGDTFESEYLNWRGWMLMSSTPIGAFAQGASPYGAEEMLGGLWEWTRSVYTPYGEDTPREITTQTGNHEGVLRGGTYYQPVTTCRCAARLHAPLYGQTSSSFRVVWRSR